MADDILCRIADCGKNVVGRGLCSCHYTRLVRHGSTDFPTKPPRDPGPIRNARQAFNKALPHYFTGEPCKRGHVAERYVGSGSCVACVKQLSAAYENERYARVKAWRDVHPEARTEEARRYRAKHPDKVRANKKRHRERHLDEIRASDRAAARIRSLDPEGVKRRKARFRERREAKYLALAGGRPRPSCCDICHEKHPLIVFDHCHKYGHFRGWLCDRCNKVLGLIKDSPTLLRAMARYLEKSNGKAEHKGAERAPFDFFRWAEPELPDSG